MGASEVGGGTCCRSGAALSVRQRTERRSVRQRTDAGVRTHPAWSRRWPHELEMPGEPARLPGRMGAGGATRADVAVQPGLSGMPLRRHTGTDGDAAVLEIPAMAVPRHASYCAFGVRHIQGKMQAARLGEPLLLVGFPLGVYDTRHHLPVARSAVVSSAFGMRFQGQGCFITEGRAGQHGARHAAACRARPEPGLVRGCVAGVDTVTMPLNKPLCALPNTQTQVALGRVLISTQRPPGRFHARTS